MQILLHIYEDTFKEEWLHQLYIIYILAAIDSYNNRNVNK